MAFNPHYDYIRAATKDTVKRHQITGLHIGKVIHIYDGDTCWVAISIPTQDERFRIEYLTVRMLEYDSPEMRTTGGVDHKPYGKEVRDVFQVLALNKMVIISIPVPNKPDPYGRVLAHLYVLERGAQIPVLRPEGHHAAARDINPKDFITITAADTRSKYQATTAINVRGQNIMVPVTVDIPSGFEVNKANLKFLTHANQWMRDNARVKPYVGGTRNWSADEIANGI